MESVLQASCVTEGPLPWVWLVIFSRFHSESLSLQEYHRRDRCSLGALYQGAHILIVSLLIIFCFISRLRWCPPAFCTEFTVLPIVIKLLCERLYETANILFLTKLSTYSFIDSYQCGLVDDYYFTRWVKHLLPSLLILCLHFCRCSSSHRCCVVLASMSFPPSPSGLERFILTQNILS
jgi:hypothetical protein